MKKKCTNSACRRVFTPWQDGGIVKCPHCGKAYPRLKPAQTRIPSLVLMGWKPDAHKRLAIRKLRKLLNLGLRDTVLLLNRMHEEPIVLREVDAGHIHEEKEEWESFGVVVRLDWASPGARREPPKKRSYMVLLSGYEPGSKEAARQYLRNRGHWHPEDELDTLDHQRIVVIRGTDAVRANNMAALAKEQGLSVVVLREHP